MAKTPKGKKTREKVFQAAIECVLKHGWEGTTFHRIAEIAGVTQPLVSHYFGAKSNLLPSLYDYIADRDISDLAAGLKTLEHPLEKIFFYNEFYLKLVRDQPTIFSFYLLRYYRSTFDKKEREIQYRRKNNGLDRFVAWIEEGQRMGEFTVDDIPATAQVLHDALQGQLINHLISPRRVPFEKSVQEFQSFCRNALVRHT